ncbi:MAG TPA: glycosyltransferase [Verrucomicrobiae bacterium]|nr:glycosyltransferase [Verrucomicrobiae bacterium]
MRIVMFYHTLRSDWNHGNAHFLRGVVTELLARGHAVKVFEPKNSWSYKNLVAGHGLAPIRKFRAAYPALESTRYDLKTLDLEAALAGADLILVHEWNDPELVRRVGTCRSQLRSCRLLFHDTHHRLITEPRSMEAYDLSNYDGVLAYGKVLQELYEAGGRVRQAWTWHEGADIRVFKPAPHPATEGDLVWIGNWGDGERSAEIEEFLVQPVKALSLKARVYGVRYPEAAKNILSKAGIGHAGWLPNFEVPRVFGRYKVTTHIPRRPYVEKLPGIPTIRVFEALACGIPLVCSPWEDVEGLFCSGTDFLVARNGREMKRLLKAVLNDAALAAELARNGLRVIRARHTCAHRVDELLAINAELRQPAEWMTAI